MAEERTTPPPSDLRLFNRTYIPLMADVPVFDIRNGVPEGACSLLVRATIPTRYHWQGITGMPADRALGYLDAFIAVYREQISADRPAGMTPEQVKKAAICLAVSRAIAIAYYRVNDAEIIPGEKAMNMMAYESLPNTSEGGRLRIAGIVPDDAAERIQQPLALTEADRNAMTVLLRCCLGVVPLQGYSLMLTNHHYLSDPSTQSRKAFAAVEKQFWREPAIHDWVEADKEMIQDLLWHKSCHPVNMAIKLRAATNDAVREQLTIAGVGSAAARLPALETDARSGASYIALFDVVRPMFNMYNGGITYDLLELALDTVKQYPPSIENPAPLEPRDSRIPAGVTNRRTAVAWVTQIVKRNSATAAQCYGFYIAMSERSTMAGTGGGVDTLRSSFALKKLTQTNLPSYTVGYEQFGDYAAARAKARSKGTFEAPVFQIE